MTVQALDTQRRSPIAKMPSYQLEGVFPSNSADTVLVDLSLFAKTGIRGKAASQLLEKAGLVIPEKPNQIVDANGVSVLRLSENEFWLLADIETNSLPEIASGEGCYQLFCQESHAWFAFKSPHKAQVMAKVCGVDLKEQGFPLGSVAQTVVAGSHAIVIHHTVNKNPVFSILCDRAVAHYIWSVLLDAMDEFKGQALAVSDL